MKRKFLNIDIEEPPLELELSVEQRCRDILACNDTYSIKRYCVHLVRHQMRQDVFLSSLLARLVELQAQVTRNERKTKRKSLFKSLKGFFRIL